MSALNSVYSGIKAILLMEERFDRIDYRLRNLGNDVGRLAGSHVELAQRVATLEGYLRGRADQAATQTLLTRSENDSGVA